MEKNRKGHIMGNREEKRNLETIPAGSLGIIALEGCRPLSERIDKYLVRWRRERESEHKESLAFSGYQRDSYLLQSRVPRFGSGEAKGIINESVLKSMSLVSAPFYNIIVYFAAHLFAAVKSDDPQSSYRYVLKNTVIAA